MKKKRLWSLKMQKPSMITRMIQCTKRERVSLDLTKSRRVLLREIEDRTRNNRLRASRYSEPQSILRITYLLLKMSIHKLKALQMSMVKTKKASFKRRSENKLIRSLPALQSLLHHPTKSKHWRKFNHIKKMMRAPRFLERKRSLKIKIRLRSSLSHITMWSKIEIRILQMEIGRQSWCPTWMMLKMTWPLTTQEQAKWINQTDLSSKESWTRKMSKFWNKFARERK